MGEYGFLCTGNERHLGAKAGLADLEAIQCGWKELSVKLGWNWVSKYI